MRYLNKWGVRNWLGSNAAHASVFLKGVNVDIWDVGIYGCTFCGLAESYLKLQILKAIEKTDMSNPMDWFLQEVWEEPLPSEYYTTPTPPSTPAFNLFNDDYEDMDWGDMDWGDRRRKRELEGPCQQWSCLNRQNYSRSSLTKLYLRIEVSVLERHSKA